MSQGEKLLRPLPDVGEGRGEGEKDPGFPIKDVGNDKKRRRELFTIEGNMKGELMGHKCWLAVLMCAGALVLSSGIALGEDEQEVLVLQPDADGIQRALIVLDSYAYTPPHISVQAGLPIEFRFENQSFLTPHNFVLDYPDVALQHDVSVDAGDSVTIRFSVQTSGTYTFYCDKQLLFFPSHREEGMEGRLEVRPESR